MYDLLDDMVIHIQKKQRKFQVLADRYAVAPEISIKQAKEILGKDFPVNVVEHLRTPEGRKAM